jgi:hypothetical protein
MPMPTPMWQQFVLGSNVIENCSGVLIADGHELFYLERGQRDEQLLLTVDVYDDRGERLAKLRRNAWVFHHERFEITTAPSALTLTDASTQAVLLSAQVHDRDRIEVDRCHLFSAEGSMIDAEPDQLVINGRVTLKSNMISGMNSAFLIDKDAFVIGVGPGGLPQHLLNDAD